MTLVQALMNPAAYPHPVREIRHVQTHISDVFLTGPFAYKIKKAVNFGFLDFSSLEKRQYYCEREVSLNRRLAPDIYLGVVPVYDEGGETWVGEVPTSIQGAPPRAAEYAVKMVQFDQEGLLDRLAERGALPPNLITDLARQVAHFHGSAERADRFGTPERVREYVLANFDQTRKFRGEVIPAGLFDRLRSFSEDFLKDQADRFYKRMEAGAIRVCHGDLHLQNICLDGGRLIIFDCIEFNDALNHIDAFSETAFLLMDLEHRGLPGSANRFLNAYLDDARDYQGLSVLDFYLVYRACVRGKVAFLLSDEPEVAEVEKAAARQRALSYFELAGRFLKPGTPRLLLTSGVSGSGKSTVAAALAEKWGAVTIRSDAVRKTLAGMDPGQARGGGAPTDYAKGIYDPEMTERTYEGLLERAAIVVESGRPAILDATYLRSRHRSAAQEWADRRGLPFAVLHCTAPLPILEARLRSRAAAGTDLSDADIEVMRRQRSAFDAFEGSAVERVVTLATEKDWDAARIEADLAHVMSAPDRS